MATKANLRRGLQRVEKFVEGPYPHKYTAVMKDGSRVRFGDSRYQQYRDSVPRSMGGGQWSHLDHNDAARRRGYRNRHGGIKTKSGMAAYKVKYSPSWFSYYYLW